MSQRVDDEKLSFGCVKDAGDWCVCSIERNHQVREEKHIFKQPLSFTTSHCLRIDVSIKTPEIN